MENALEAVENNGDISFGEARCNKCEKYKIDFLCLKSKIFKSKELIEKYKILKENLYRAKECTKEKEKLLESERSANKAIRLKMNSEKLAINAVTKEKSQLIKQIEELNTKVQAQAKFNEQLTSRIEELENENKEKLMDKDLKLSGLKLDNQELKQKLQVYQKKDPKFSKKMERLEKQKKLKKSQPFNSTRNTGLVDLSALDNVSEEPGSPMEHEVDTSLEQECDIPLENLPTRDQGTDTCDLSFEPVPSPRKCGSKNIMRNMECQVGLKLQDKSTMTEDVSRSQELYPLYCKECHKSLGPKPIDEILNTMTYLSPKLDAIESPEAPRKSLPAILPSTSTYNDDATQNAGEIAHFALRQDGGQMSQNGGEKIEKRLGRIEKQLKGLQKGQAPCCGHTGGGGDLQVNLLTTLLEKVLRKSPVKRKRKELKGRVAKKKIKRSSRGRVHDKSSRSRKKKSSRMFRSSSRSSSESVSSWNSSFSRSSRFSSSSRSSVMSRSLSRSSRKPCSRNRKRSEGSSYRNPSRVGSRNRNSPSPSSKNNNRSLDSRSRNRERSVGFNSKNPSRSSSRNCNSPCPSPKNNKSSLDSRSRNRESSVGSNPRNPSRSSSRNCISPSPISKNNKRSDSSSSQNRNRSLSPVNRERSKSLSKEPTPRSSSKDSIQSRVRKPRRRLISDDELEPFQEPTNSESDISVPKFKNPVSAVKNRPNPRMFSPDLIEKTINNTLEVPEPKRKGTKAPKTTAQVQTQLLKKLRRLKTNKPATTPCSSSLTPTEVCEVTKRKRIAHVPKEQGEVTQLIKKRKTRSMAAKKSDCSSEIPKDVMEPESGTENRETKVSESSSPESVLVKEVSPVKRRVGRPPKNSGVAGAKKKYSKKTVLEKKAILESSEASDNVLESLGTKETPSEAESSRTEVLESLEPKAVEGSEVLECSGADVGNSDVSPALEKSEVLNKTQAMEISDTPVVENSKESSKVLESSSDQNSKVVESLNSKSPKLLERSIPERSSVQSLEGLESSDEETPVIENSNFKTPDIKETPELLESSTVKSSEATELTDAGLPLLENLIDETPEHEHSVNSPEVIDSFNTESPLSPVPEGSIEANLANIFSETSAEPKNLEPEPQELNAENILECPESPDPTSDELILDTATSSESPEISLGIDIAMNLEISEEESAVRSELKDMVVESSSEASDIEMDVETTLEPAILESEPEVAEKISDSSENAFIPVPKILEPRKLVTVPRMLPKTVEKPCKSNKPIALGRKSSNAKTPEVIVTKPDSEVLESQNSSMNTRTLRSRTVSISPSRVLPKIRKISPTKNDSEVPSISPGTQENDSKTLESRTLVPRTLVPGTTSPVTDIPRTSIPKTLVPDSLVLETAILKKSVPETQVSRTSVPGSSATGTVTHRNSVPKTPVPRSSIPGTVNLESSVPGTSVSRTMEPPLTTEILLKNYDSFLEGSNVLSKEPQRQRSIQNLLDFYLLTRTTPVIIQNSALYRNVAIMLSDSAKKKIQTEFQRFLDYEWTCELNNSLIANLRNLEPVTIASALVEVLKERAELHEPLSYKHTPPAPPMTVSQQKLIGFLAKFEIDRPGTMEHVMVIIAQSLFKVKTIKDDDEVDIEALQGLSRFFILITKIKKDRERARIFLCDALYALQTKAFYVLHIIITCWAEVIPRYDESTMSFLSTGGNLTQNGGQGTQNDGSEQNDGQVRQIPSFYSEISENLALKPVRSQNGRQGSQNGGGSQNDVIETRKKYLVISIATVIKNHQNQSKNDNITKKIINVKRLLKTLYNYPDEFISTKIIENLLEAIKVKRENSCLIAAIVLLAKKEGVIWASQHVVPKLVKMVITGGASNNAYEILTLLGYILRPFPLNEENKQVEKVITRLCQILDTKTKPAEFQEGAAMALMLLARNSFVKSAPTLLRWRPTRPITGELKTKLQHWFESRTPQYWNQFLKNNDLQVGKGLKLK